MPDSVSVAGHLVNLHDREMRPVTVHVQDGVIDRIEPSEDVPDQYLLPGFIDAHVHVESSMLPPSEFARAAVVHGTVGTVSDPHEIANVLTVPCTTAARANSEGGNIELSTCTCASMNPGKRY